MAAFARQKHVFKPFSSYFSGRNVNKVAVEGRIHCGTVGFNCFSFSKTAFSLQTTHACLEKKEQLCRDELCFPTICQLLVHHER